MSDKGNVDIAKQKKKKKSVEQNKSEDSPAASLATDFMIKPENKSYKIDTSKSELLKSFVILPKYFIFYFRWPLLLKNYDQLHVRSAHYTPLPCGMSPLKRNLKEYMHYGVLNLDKPANPSSHEVCKSRI